MFSPFVKGLMCATLIRLGASSAVVLIQGFTYHRFYAITPVVYRRICGVATGVLIVHAQRDRGSPCIRISFIFRSVNIVVPIWTTIANIIPPTSKSASLFSGFLYLFPCVVAIVIAGRRALKTSNQSLQPTAGRRDDQL